MSSELSESNPTSVTETTEPAVVLPIDVNLKTDDVVSFPIETAVDDKTKWKINAFDVGSPYLCLFSFFCPCLAMGYSRHQLDGSDWIVSCCCLNYPTMRWITRTAYGIEGNAHYDCWYGFFCPCCAINQIIQTVQVRERADFPRFGPAYNTRHRTGIANKNRPIQELLYALFYSCFCYPCAKGYVMQSVGMPFWFGACCVPLYAANSVTRYHHRYKPFFNWEGCADGIIPAFNLSSLYFCPIIGALLNAMFLTGMILEENENANRHDIGYGLDLMACLLYSVDYFSNNCSTCVQQDTGRYLDKEIFLPPHSPPVHTPQHR